MIISPVSENCLKGVILSFTALFPVAQPTGIQANQPIGYSIYLHIVSIVRLRFIALCGRTGNRAQLICL